MKKRYKKIFKSKILILQALYSLHINNSTSLDLNKFFIENKNINKIDCEQIFFFINGILNKNIIIQLILLKNIYCFFYINILELLILKIIIFEIFFSNKSSINIIISHGLYLSNKFCIKNSYNLIKNVSYNLINSYMILKLLS